MHGALPLHVSPSLENSLLRLVSRWKTGSQRVERYSDASSWSNGAKVIRGTSLRPLGAFALGKHAPPYTRQRRRSPALLLVEQTMSGSLRRWRQPSPGVGRSLMVGSNLIHAVGEVRLGCEASGPPRGATWVKQTQTRFFFAFLVCT